MWLRPLTTIVLDHPALRSNVRRRIDEADPEEELRQCILAGGAGGGLILSSSNTIHSGVKPENYRAMLDALRRYGNYPDLG